MRNWLKKRFEKKPAAPIAAEGQEKQDNISSLYEIVEDHLKSLDHDQLKGISGDFAERFAAHQEIISEIVKPPRHRTKPGSTPGGLGEYVVIDSIAHGPSSLPVNAATDDYPDEMILTHYDRMIRSQYDRLIDLTMDFLREVTEAEIRRLDGQTAKTASDIRDLRDDLAGQIEQLGEDIEETRLLHRDLIIALEQRMAEQNRRANLANRRIKILAAAAIGAGLVGTAALVLSLIR
jgi:hypothetical protein